MKKRIIAFICVLALAVASLVSFTGCATVDHYGKVNVVGKQDYSYVVKSNGGSAVQYGNYVYYVNGYRGYEDSDATANKFGSVVMGALYRAELEGTQTEYNATVKDFVVSKDDETKISLVADKVLNYKYDDSFDVKTQLISPKTIGTAGYKDGGIWIFDDCVYYASPANSKNKNGEVMDDHVSFFKAKLDGSKTVELYTTQEAASSSPYAFYKYNGNVYLVVLEGNKVNCINASSARPEKTVKKIAENVQSVIFPINPIYYNGMSNDSVYDYIYIKYSASDYYKESNNTNVVLEYRRPDGTDGKVIEDGNSALDLVAVRDDVVFYKTQKNNETVLVGRDYKSIFGNNNEFAGSPQESGFNEVVLYGSNLSSAKSLYPFAVGSGEVDSNRIAVLTVVAGAEETSTLKLCRLNEVVTIDTADSFAIQFVDSEKIYYTTTGVSGALRSYDITTMSSGEYEIITTATVSQDGLYFDKVGPYLVYMGQLESKFDTYTFFYDTQAYASIDAPIFVGQRLADHNRSHVEFATISDATLANIVTEYHQGEAIDLTGLEITIKEFRNKDGVVVTRTVPVTADMVSGFDTSVLSDAVTVTITYKEKGDVFDNITYEIKVIE